MDELYKKVAMIYNATILLIILAFIFVSAFIDYEHLKDNDFIESHVSRAVLRALVFLLISIHDFKLGIASALLFAALFDQVLNFLMKVDFFYLGSTAKWDIFFREKMLWYILLKSICLILGLTLIFI